MMGLVSFLEETRELTLYPPFPQQEGSHLQARKSILTQTQPCWYPDLKLSASRLRENKFLLFM